MTTETTSITPENSMEATLHGGAAANSAPLKLSVAQAAFVALADELAQASEAEMRLLDATPQDSGHALYIAEATLEAVMRAARQAGEALIVAGEDRATVQAARVIQCAMSIENNDDREFLIFSMAEARTYGGDHSGSVEKWIDDLITSAFERLARLHDLLYHPECEPQPSPPARPTISSLDATLLR